MGKYDMEWVCPHCGRRDAQPASVKWMSCAHAGRKPLDKPTVMKKVKK